MQNLKETLEILKTADVFDFYRINARLETLNIVIDDMEKDHRKIYYLKFRNGKIDVELLNLAGYDKEKKRWTTEIHALNKSYTMENRQGEKALRHYLYEVFTQDKGYSGKTNFTHFKK